MPESIPEKAYRELQLKYQRLQEEYQKISPIFNEYSTYIVISILLGMILEFKLFDCFLDNHIQLIDKYLNVSSGNPIDHRLVASTSAAILSTIFTIIFVLLTVFIQISDIYNAASLFQSKETKNLMRLYFVTIVLSLVMLEMDFQFPILVLTLTFMCILSLYPFLNSFSDKIVYDVGVGKLSAEIPSLIDEDRESHALGKIYSLASISKRSIKDSRLSDFLVTMSIFQDSTQRAKKQKMIEFIEITGLHYYSILDNSIQLNSPKYNRTTMVRLIFNQINDYISEYSDVLKCQDIDLQIYSLKDIGTKMTQTDFNGRHMDLVVNTLLNIFFSVQKKRNLKDNEKEIDEQSEIGYLAYELEPNIIESIGELATKLYNHKQEKSSFNRSVEALFLIGAKACQVHEKSLLTKSLASFEAAQQLEIIEDIIGNKKFEIIFEKMKSSKRYPFKEPELEQYFDNFKKYYNNSKGVRVIEE